MTTQPLHLSAEDAALIRGDRLAKLSALLGTTPEALRLEYMRFFKRRAEQEKAGYTTRLYGTGAMLVADGTFVPEGDPRHLKHLQDSFEQTRP